jgi:hypothetical protein
MDLVNQRSRSSDVMHRFSSSPGKGNPRPSAIANQQQFEFIDAVDEERESDGEDIDIGIEI